MNQINLYNSKKLTWKWKILFSIIIEELSSWILYEASRYLIIREIISSFDEFLFHWENN